MPPADVNAPLLGDREVRGVMSRINNVCPGEGRVSLGGRRGADKERE